MPMPWLVGVAAGGARAGVCAWAVVVCALVWGRDKDGMYDRLPYVVRTPDKLRLLSPFPPLRIISAYVVCLSL